MSTKIKKEEKDITIFISVVRKDTMITTWTETTKITDNSIDNIKGVIKSLIDSVKDKKRWIGGKIETITVKDHCNHTLYNGGDFKEFNSLLKKSLLEF